MFFGDKISISFNDKAKDIEYSKELNTLVKSFNSHFDKVSQYISPGLASKCIILFQKEINFINHKSDDIDSEALVVCPNKKLDLAQFELFKQNLFKMYLHRMQDEKKYLYMQTFHLGENYKFDYYAEQIGMPGIQTVYTSFNQDGVVSNGVDVIL